MKILLEDLRDTIVMLSVIAFFFILTPFSVFQDFLDSWVASKHKKAARNVIQDMDNIKSFPRTYFLYYKLQHYLLPLSKLQHF